MIKRALVLFLLWASPAFAAPVEVTTGEHDGFTRVVLNFGAQTDWEFGRVLDGYRFRPKGKAAEYDLAPVFDRIGKTRLAAISANAETGELDIGFACACHAIAFEFRPGIIVIDLRDGAPPKGSSFEESLPEGTRAITAPKPLPRPKTQTALPAAPPYNWLDRFAGAKMPEKPSLSPLPSSKPDLQPLRDQLLRQLSRGASEGVIDLSIPKPDGPIPPKAEVEAARVALGEMKGVVSTTVRTPDAPIGADGAQCMENAALSLVDWGAQGDASTLLSQDMAALVGEFDRPDPAVVARAAQTRIYLGFGTEARLILTAFPDAAENAAILQGLSYIVDGEADPTLAFQGQGRCETAAALWAALSDPDITQGEQLDSKAAVLAFSRLPDHLRQTLGPRLIDRFLDLEDETSATSIRNMIFWGDDPTSSEIALAEAKIELAKGDPAKAEAHLDATKDGATETSAEAQITRVAARIAQGLPVDAGTVSALAALQSEMVDTPLAPDIAIALIHAKAASGDFAGAFESLGDYPAEAAVVWRILSSLGDDSTLLTYAVPPPAAPIAGLGPETVSAIAGRILGLGLPDVALGWMQAGGPGSGADLAQIHLARRDGRAALQALENITDATANPLRAQAHSLLGQHQEAAQELIPVSDQASIPELIRAKDWQSLADIPTSQWSALSQDVTAPPDQPKDGVDTFGPLARGLALADQSAQTRAKVEKLLETVPIATE